MLHFFCFSGNEERVSSPTSAFVFILSIVGLRWVLEAAAWKWPNRSFVVLVAGPGEVLVALQMLEEWWALVDGCQMDVHICWLLPARDGSFQTCHFLCSFPSHPLDFPGRRCWDVQLQKEMELLSVCTVPALPVFPWKKQRVFYGMWPRDAFSFRMSLNLPSSAAKPSAACVGHSLKTKALKKLLFSQKIALVAVTVTESHSWWLNNGFVTIS